MIIALNVSWSEFKEIKSNLRASIYYSQGPDTSLTLFVTCPLFYATTALELEADLLDFTDNYESSAILSDTPTGALARALSIKSSTESLPVSIKPRDEPSFMQWTIVSHDYTDKTTWYQKSTQVVDEELTPDGPMTTFASANLHWVNPDHPKLYNQSYNRGSPPYDQVSLWMPDGTLVARSTFRPIIKIDDVVQTSGYSFEYSNGTVIFDDPVTGTVTATYYYATSSEFIIRPQAGLVWQIPRVEVNTTSSLFLNATTFFQYWRDPAFEFSNQAFMLSEMPYQSFSQMQASATCGADQYAAMGGSGIMAPSAENGWGHGYVRGTDQISIIMPWNYRKPFIMTNAQSDAIRIYTTNHNIHLGADYLTATFYVEQTPEA